MKAPILTPFFSLPIIFLSLSLHAQNARPSFGLSAGATFASYKVTTDAASLSSKIKAGFTLGLISSFSVGAHFTLQPGIDLTQKGGVLKDDMGGTTNTATFNYLEIPVNIVYHPNTAKEGLFLGAGPSVNIGLWGKYKITGSYTESGSIKFGSGDNDDLKIFDLGANLVAGYQFKSGWIITANYTWGITNLSADSKGQFRNNCFGIRLGYFFGKNATGK